METQKSPPTLHRSLAERPALSGRPGALLWPLGVALAGLLGGCGLPPEAEDEQTSQQQELVIRINIPTNPPDSGGGGRSSKAEISLDSQFVFFPQICAGGSAKKTLVLRNRGEDPLVVRKLEVEGRAFSLDADVRLPKTLRPGERLELSITYSPPANRPDQLDHSGVLRITSNDRHREVTSIQLRGLVPPQSLALSMRQIFVGDLGAGQAYTRTLTLRNAGLCPVEVGGYETAGRQGDGVFVDGLQRGLLQPGHINRVSVTTMCIRRGEIDARLRFLSPRGNTLATALIQGSCY
ncbi:MAG: hypothetical protein RMK29_06460 [Myxococcales bacterium]|nr:hypothetical protein [Myxococcota bacterium]MDW8281335.1 hypothetical protein [Myxococcales bacterium]